MKRGVISILYFILFLPLISAQVFGSYSNFSFTDIISSIEPQTIFVLIVFGISFILVKTILERMEALKEASTALGIIVALGAAYGVNRIVSVNNLFSGFGLSEDLLMILTIIFLILLIWLLIKYKYKTFLILGLLLVLVSIFTDIFYNKEGLLVIGAVFMIIGFIWWLISRRKGLPKLNKIPSIPQTTPEQVKQQAVQEKITQRTQAEKINLVRKIGLRNLYSEYERFETEYNQGVENAKQLHKKATSLGWNKTKEGNEYYKAWYRQYQRLDEIRRKMVDIRNRIDYLKKQIR